jgi:hypothetical protein
MPKSQKHRYETKRVGVSTSSEGEPRNMGTVGWQYDDQHPGTQRSVRRSSATDNQRIPGRAQNWK